MAKCLVTGYKGYIGSKLFKSLQDLGHEVMGIDLEGENSLNVITELEEQEDGSFKFDYSSFKPEYIFHLACWPRIGLCLQDPVGTMKNNVLAGSVLLNFARKIGSVKRVIYSSSSSVVGNGNGPTNPYALQKLVTEQECKIYSEVYDLDTVNLRYFNVYSEDQSADGPYATAIANWRKSLLSNNRPFITGNGEQRRDMVHVKDVVSANIFCLEQEEDFCGQYFDVGTGTNISLNEVRDIILEYHDTKFDYTDARSGEVNSTLANIEPLRLLGWHAKISIHQGIRKCFDFTNP